MKTRFVLFVSCLIALLGSSVSCSDVKKESAEQDRLLEIRTQLKTAEKGDIIRYKDLRRMCYIIYADAEKYRCTKFVGAVNEEFVIADDHATSQIREVVSSEEGAYTIIGPQFLRQNLSH